MGLTEAHITPITSFTGAETVTPRPAGPGEAERRDRRGGEGPAYLPGSGPRSATTFLSERALPSPKQETRGGGRRGWARRTQDNSGGQGRWLGAVWAVPRETWAHLWGPQTPAPGSQGLEHVTASQGLSFLACKMGQSIRLMIINSR